MPKMKSHSGAKKRFRKTAKGKLKARHGMTSHILEKKSAKRKRVTDAITSLQGRKVRNAAGDVSGIDAVTGATRYHARIYASFDLMVRAALKEMDADPEWPRTALTTP